MSSGERCEWSATAGMGEDEPIKFELDISDDVTPDKVLAYTKPTVGYQCALSANIYGIEFLNFKIRDIKSNALLFSVERDPETIGMALPEDISPEMEDQIRCISYDFGTGFLNLESIGTMLEFQVGPHEVPNFRMIERHYFRDQLVKSYDFNFGFCIPSSQNTWEAIYDVPPLEPDLRQAMIDNPYDTQSDSFYFVGDTLIMHNKAKYAYTEKGSLQS